MPETDDLANVEIDTTRMIGWVPPKSEHVLYDTPVMGHLGMKPEIVVPERGVEVAAARQLRELRRGDRAATPGLAPVERTVGDLPGRRNTVDDDRLDPLDMADDRAPHGVQACTFRAIMAGRW